MRIAGLALVAAMFAGPALAQREAISPSLSPEAAAEAFEDAVVAICVPAVTATGVQGLPAAVKARISPTNDVETRKQAGAAADETVWDVAAAKGVVTIHEKAGRCVASVYGPAAGPTMVTLTRMISAAGFEPLAGPGRIGAMEQTLMKQAGGKRVMVVLNGSEPGMPGHRSKFSVVTATVFVS
ncbi:MAG TPA: hypothetical protein VG942_11810 [Hyphomonadaceae bacterium]|nr:hypothetical protein [Hyphomonadaceae bacterium]